MQDCSNIKRAIGTHETTMIAVNVLILRGTLRWYDGWNSNINSKEIVEMMKLATDSMKTKKPKKFREAWNKTSSIMIIFEIEGKNKWVWAKYSNYLLQFFVKYPDMVTRFLTFIEATRPRNWKLHLDPSEDMIPDFASINYIDYRRLFAIYIADMNHL